MHPPAVSSGAVTGTVRALPRVEGFLVLALSLLLYWHSGFNWWTFFGLLLIPDLSMLAYLLNPRIGGACIFGLPILASIGSSVTV